MADEGTTDAVTAALDKVLARLDTLEQKVDRLGGGAAAPPADGRQAAVDRILGRLDTIEASLDMMESFQKRAPVLVDAAATVAGKAWAGAEARGIDVFARAEKAAELAVEATDPEALELLGELLSRKDLLRTLVQSADDLEAALTEAGTDLKTFTKSGIGMTTRLAVLMGSEEFEKFGTSGVFEPATVTVMTNAGQALVDTRAEPVERVGLFGALKAMGDPDVQKAVGFALRIARRFGQLLPSR